MANLIPADVTARLLPKTLFGEKFVSLVPPENATDAGKARIAAGDVIPEDRSQSAREVEQVLNDLLPLLQAVKPQQLATTLGALSQSLSGRGAELGRTLVQLNSLLDGLNPSIPDLQAESRSWRTSRRTSRTPHRTCSTHSTTSRSPARRSWTRRTA